MLLDDIATLLTDGGMGTIYKDYMPPTPDLATVVYTNGGLAPTHTMVPPHVLEEPRIQVVSRAVSLEGAQQAAKNAYEILCGVRTTAVNGVMYHWITAEQEPRLLGRDQNARFTVACSYAIKKDRST